MFVNDVALVRVDSPMTPGKTSRGICLPREKDWSDQLEGRYGKISGWGQVKYCN